GAVFAIERTQLYRDDKGRLRFNPPMPLDKFRAEAKRQLENILISIKAKNKVVTRNINKAKNKVTSNVIVNGEEKTIKGQIVKTPRGQLHNESIYGSYKKVVVNVEKVNASFDASKIATVSSPRYREALLARLASCGNDPKKAFTGKNSLDKNPLWLNELHTDKVPEKVKTVTYEVAFTIRKPISPDLNVDKVVDCHIKTILEDRLKEYGGDAKKAFSNLEENPIWLNKSKGIALKRVTISGVNNVEALHSKRDKDGNLCLSKDCLKQPVDFVSTSNNHHVAIYQKPILDKDKLPQTDDNGNIKYELEENIVSFYEATSRAMLGLPIIDKEFKKDEGWQFLFTMKQNEYFVFPHYDENGNMVFNPTEFSKEWFKNPDNYAIISSNLYRVQKLTSKDYFFRHHLETQVQDITKLKGVTWKRCGLQGINGIVKVRINHIGKIVSVGEY
ncbi:MAG: type II CRISPR RNA-guided endonuclease Cas9, partial [Alphaproteobacteria bacterium]|nr:type II CRISPR RNA-guided endonuclease Cas9 [Alphaproteobacteria bacterium]